MQFSSSMLLFVTITCELNVGNNDSLKSYRKNSQYFYNSDSYVTAMTLDTRHVTRDGSEGKQLVVSYGFRQPFRSG